MLAFRLRTVVGVGRRAYADTFTTSTNSFYIEQLYDQWKTDPQSVHISWQTYFQGFEVDSPGAFLAPPEIASTVTGPKPAAGTQERMTSAKQAAKICMLHRGYNAYGFLLADVDPLRLHTNLAENNPEKRIPGPIKVENYGFTPEDFDKEFDLGNHFIDGYLSKFGPRQGRWRLGELIEKLQQAYCGKLGFEFMHVPFRDESNWIRRQIETETRFSYTPEERKVLYERLARAHLLEEFFHIKFTTHKRFGLDGLEGLVPLVESVITQAVANGVTSFVIGAPHRGRLNLMINILQMPLDSVLSMFLGTNQRLYQEGDVKYHLGYTTTRQIDGKDVTISLLANPSHLEAVDPVTIGKTRAIQNFTNDKDRSMAILIHGDAALAGQGVVYETVQMHDLHDYSVGGVVHIVANNNIGFTTTPRQARYGNFPTEIAKTIGAPIVHINSEYLEEIDFAGKMAANFRNEFRKSIFLDLIGYRRHGHNELDEPLFTNPLMYQLIHKQKPAYLLVGDRLKQEEVIDDSYARTLMQQIKDEYNKAFALAKEVSDDDLKATFKTYTEWSQIQFQKSDALTTGLPIPVLKEIGTLMTEIPEDFNIHPQIQRNYNQRRQAIESGEGIDWATGEALAWASIMTQEKFPVRIAGQDVQRGTFSHRHAVLHDQKIDRKFYVPLNHLTSDQAYFKAINSHLSEYGALGFEYGYSITNPNCLVIWEAQFGDFANEAQIIIDQFIASGEAKWGQQTGLVLLLPHGYEGQGAEHSCARPERFLQMSSDDPYTIPTEQIEERKQIFNNNLQLCIPTTPANYFHMLRRQIRRDFRKPLIVMSPKRLLRHKEAVSSLEEFTTERVERLYDDVNPNLVDPKQVRKVLLCSGNVYYDLHAERREKQINDIAIARVEQVAPFPFDQVQLLAVKYPNAKFVWAQEEPQNYGCWHYVQMRIDTALQSKGIEPIGYVGRHSAAATATGYNKLHQEELRTLLEEAMS